MKKVLEEKSSKAYSGPSQASRMNYFCKNKNNLNKVLERSMLDF